MKGIDEAIIAVEGNNGHVDDLFEPEITDAVPVSYSKMSSFASITDVVNTHGEPPGCLF